MNHQKNFDIIIAGAGASGLSLIWRLLESDTLKESKILLIDQSFEGGQSKTWCFWEDLELPGSNLIHHSWDHLLVNFETNTYSEQIQNYRYRCLRSDDFHNHVFTMLRARQNVTILEAQVHDFKSTGEHAEIHTSEGIFSAHTIFQSVLKPPGFHDLTVDISLKQHFLGLEIETDHNEVFNPNIAIFMDFDVSQKDGITFMYLLPFSKKKALVEYTIFSKQILPKDDYKSEIFNYLKSNYGLEKNEYLVVREEFGAIPMEDRKYPSRYCKNVWNIGTVMGLPKPSTGYAYSRIQHHSKKIVQALEEGENLKSIDPVSSYRFRVYDLMMLFLMNSEQKNAIRAFENLFNKNSFDLVLKFLAEDTHFLQELSIFSKMPYIPFLRSIYKMKHRIMTGA